MGHNMEIVKEGIWWSTQRGWGDLFICVLDKKKKVATGSLPPVHGNNSELIMAGRLLLLLDSHEGNKRGEAQRPRRGG